MKFNALISLTAVYFATLASAAPTTGQITVKISLPGTSLADGLNNDCPATCNSDADCAPCLGGYNTCLPSGYGRYNTCKYCPGCT
ncbi:hypothetical protein FB451DRAFT_1288713 [Mycena latifolia]|nr:hypothetical protein FB451DRAFT_1288713 [Mycena latifolia]